jgi:predicted DNA-binding transcriptional regulator AlpA
MKTLLEQEDIQAIAEKVVSMILPLLSKSPEQNDILNVDEVSALLGKSKGQVYQWVSDSSHELNNFPFLKAGKSLRFSQKAIIEWMQGNGKK